MNMVGEETPRRDQRMAAHRDGAHDVEFHAAADEPTKV
jgi:hypothetical protein